MKYCYHLQESLRSHIMECYSQIAELVPDKLVLDKNGVMFSKDAVLLEEFFQLSVRQVGSLLFEVDHLEVMNQDLVLSQVDTMGNLLYVSIGLRPLRRFWDMLDVTPRDVDIVTIASVSRMRDNPGMLCFRPLRTFSSMFCNKYLSIEQFCRLVLDRRVVLYKTPGFMAKNDLEGYGPDALFFQHQLDLLNQECCPGQFGLEDPEEDEDDE